jgi:hypothetical protein
MAQDSTAVVATRAETMAVAASETVWMAAVEVETTGGMKVALVALVVATTGSEARAATRATAAAAVGNLAECAVAPRVVGATAAD